MGELYRIVDWDKHYENNRTRGMRVMSWVPIKAKLAGDGYTELVACRDGAAVYGAWIACVLVAASCDPRGTLVRYNGEPHNADSLSRITRFSTRVIERMLEATEAVGWIEVAGGRQEGADKRQEGASKVPSLEGRKEQKETNAHPGSRVRAVMTKPVWNRTAFDAFWQEYPRKVAKQAARKAWKKLYPGDDLDIARARMKNILALLGERIDGEWAKREKETIPYPASFLNGEDFDEAPE